MKLLLECPDIFCPLFYTFRFELDKDKEGCLSTALHKVTILWRVNRRILWKDVVKKHDDRQVE